MLPRHATPLFKFDSISISKISFHCGSGHRGDEEMHLQEGAVKKMERETQRGEGRGEIGKGNGIGKQKSQ